MLPQITNPIITNSNENGLEDIMNKEFKRMIWLYSNNSNWILIYSKQSKNKEMNEMQKSFQVNNIEFNKEKELSKKTQAEMMLEVKNLISQIKMSVESLTRRN